MLISRLDRPVAQSVARPRLRRPRRRDGASLIAVALATLAAMPLQAQVDTAAPAAPAAPAADASGQAAAPAADTTIVVTGSRISRPGFTAPTPITSVGVDDVLKQGASNIADVLATVPAFGQGSNPTSSNHTSINPGANIVNLRSLGQSRTLVLVDGRRFVPETVQGRVDLNVIPTVLIDRTDVVTGGASAAWGSDAVSGVVNLVFKKKQTGLQGDFTFGLSDHGDDKSYKGSLSYGHNFAGDRGNFIIAGEWDDERGIGPGSGRSQLLSKWQVITNPGYKLGNGQPQQFLVDNVNFSTATLGGLITSGPLKGTQFLPGGVAAPFTYGTLVGSQYMVGGSPIGPVTPNQLGTLVVPLKRENIYARTSYEFSRAFTLFGEASWARSYSRMDLSLPFNFANLTMNYANPFLPASLQQQIAAQHLTGTFTLGRLSQDIGYNQPVNVNKVYRFMVGAEGRFALLGNDWHYGAYFQFGADHYSEDVNNNIKSANFRNAMDAVIAPGGQIVCRSTLGNPADGCVPINLFGAGSPSQSAINYITGTSMQRDVFKEQSAAINLNGKLFDDWAGPVSLAVGAEWRHDSVVQTADPLSTVSGFNIHNPKPIAGSTSVREVYAEVDVPLLADKPLVKSLDFNGAVRYADYHPSGGVTSWKIGGTWEVNDWFRLRATKSRDVRAPALGELYAPQITQTAAIIDPLLNNQQFTVSDPQVGNANLKAEQGDTWTVGTIVRPLRGLSLSVDYYSITISNAIGLPAPADIVSGCYANNIQNYCALITRNGPTQANGVNVISQILRAYINQGTLRQNGIDFEVDYSSRVPNLFHLLDGNISTRLLATYVPTFYQLYNNVRTTYAGVVGTNQGAIATGSGGMPHWRATASADYVQGPVDFYLEGQFIGGGIYGSVQDAAGVYTILRPDGSQDIKGQFLLAASLQYTIKQFSGGRRLQIFGAVRNITNNIQVGNPYAYLLSTTGNPYLYDIVGRTYKMGIRFKL